jgi:hypothetical protein
MKKKSLIKWAVVVIIIAASSCEQEPLEFEASTSSNLMNLDIRSGQFPDLRLDCSNRPDLIIQSLTDNIHLLQPSSGLFPFVVTIKNIGEAEATIKNQTTHKVWWQAWQSKNGVTRDTPVCGQSFLPGTIDINQTKTAIKQYCRLEDLISYPYLIVDLHTVDGSVDCNKSNNTYVLQLLATSVLP